MTDLTGKFTALEQLMGQNHIAVMGKLDDILQAIQNGGQPGDVTLQDLLDALNLIYAGMQSLGLNQQNTNTQLAQLRGLVSVSNSLLGPLATSANSILSFMTTFDWCCQGSAIDPITPQLGTNPSTDDILRCQKAQLVVDIWVAIIDQFDLELNKIGPTTNFDVHYIYASIGALASISKPSQDECSRLSYAINQARALGLSNLGGLAFSFRAQMRDTLWNSDNASLARTNVVSMWQQPSGGQPVWDIMAYAIHNALLNDLFEDDSRNLSAGNYNGNACASIELGCISTTSIQVEATPSNGYSPRWNAVFPNTGAINSIEYAPDLFAAYNEAVIMRTGFQGGRIYYKSGRVRVVYGNEGLNTHFISLSTPNTWVEIPEGADYLILDDFEAPNTPGTGSFQVTLCIGGEEV